jgi:hypothetical protein
VWSRWYYRAGSRCFRVDGSWNEPLFGLVDTDDSARTNTK